MQPEPRTKTERLVKGLPAVGAIAGGTLGFLRPGLIEARHAGGSVKQKLMAGLLGAGTGATLGWLPDVLHEGAKAVGPEKVASIEQRGRELVQYMWDELEKIANLPSVLRRSAVGVPNEMTPAWMAHAAGRDAAKNFGAARKPAASDPSLRVLLARRSQKDGAYWKGLAKSAAYNMELTPSPWELGIHAKRKKDPQRGIAYTSHLGRAAATGVVAGAGPGLLLGGPIGYRVLTEKGRNAAIDDAAKDTATAGKAYVKAKAEIAGKTFHDLVMHPTTDKALDTMFHEIKSGLSSPEIRALVSRRAKGMGEAMLSAGVVATGLQGAHNVAQYEAAKALTNKEKGAGAKPKARTPNQASGKAPAQTELEAVGDQQDPIAEVLGTEVEQLDEKRARGYPILQAPPGYVFQPDLSAFVPDMNQPGWMSEQDAQQAQNNQSWYQQGQGDQQEGMAQQELDTAVGQHADVASQQQIAQNQQLAANDIELQKQMQKVQTPPKISGKAAAPKSSSSSPKKPAAKKKADGSTEKGVTIKIGR